MASQFIRLTCYGSQAGARRKQHENAFDILDEAARVPGATPHIRSPKPPTLLHGSPIGTIKTQITAFAKIARDERGAPIRRGGALVYALVVSYPVPWRQLDRENGIETYGNWKEKVIGWLMEKFSSHLASVVEHVDEGQPHLHAVIIPPLCPRNRIDHSLHPGRAARARVLGAGGDRLAGERAYREGMRAFQSDFFNSVSTGFGHTRVGPKRKRFMRDVALARRASGRLLERAETIAARLLARINAMPDLALAPERAELATFVNLFASARNQLCNGRFDALEALDLGLAALETSDSKNGKGGGQDAMAPSVELGSHGWDADDDPHPGEFEDFDLDADDDPDVEALIRNQDDWVADSDLSDDAGPNWDEGTSFDPDDNPE